LWTSRPHRSKTSIEIMELISRRPSESSIPAIVNNHKVEQARRYAARCDAW
jgi:ABC-type phosphate/phosphonate transport system ATPase subunit